MKKNEELLSCLAPTTTSAKSITDRFSQNIPPVYLGLMINTEQAILRCYSRDVSELV